MKILDLPLLRIKPSSIKMPRKVLCNIHSTKRISSRLALLFYITRELFNNFFKDIIHAEGEILHLVNATSWVQEGENILGPRRREGEIRYLVNSVSCVGEGGIRHLANSTSWIQEDKKVRFGISSTQLFGSKMTRRRDPAFRQLDLLGSRRRKGDIRHLVNSTSLIQEGVGDEIRLLVYSTSWVREDESWVLRSRWVEFLRPKRREGEFLDLVRLISWVQEGKNQVDFLAWVQEGEKVNLQKCVLKALRRISHVKLYKCVTNFSNCNQAN